MTATAETTRGCVRADIMRQRLRETLGVYYRSCVWTLGWCRQVKARIPEGDIEGLHLNAYEMRFLGLDLGVVLRQIAAETYRASLKAEPPLDYWSHAVQRYAYRTADDELRWARPGSKVPDGCTVEKVQFRSNPKHLPFSDLCESLRRYGRPLGLKSWNLLFSYEGVTIENASELADVVKAFGLSTHTVGEALLEWRDKSYAMVGGCEMAEATQAPAKKESAEEEEPPVDPRLEGLVMPRPMLAKAIGKSIRTLKNWDKAGYVPTGVKWHPPTRVSGNMAMYEVGRNWPAIQSMMPVERDRDADRQLAEELLAIKSDGKEDE